MDGFRERLRGHQGRHELWRGKSTARLGERSSSSSKVGQAVLGWRNHVDDSGLTDDWVLLRGGEVVGSNFWLGDRMVVGHWFAPICMQREGSRAERRSCLYTWLAYHNTQKGGFHRRQSCPGRSPYLTLRAPTSEALDRLDRIDWAHHVDC